MKKAICILIIVLLLPTLWGLTGCGLLDDVYRINGKSYVHVDLVPVYADMQEYQGEYDIDGSTHKVFSCTDDTEKQFLRVANKRKGFYNANSVLGCTTVADPTPFDNSIVAVYIGNYRYDASTAIAKTILIAIDGLQRSGEELNVGREPSYRIYVEYDGYMGVVDSNYILNTYDDGLYLEYDRQYISQQPVDIDPMTLPINGFIYEPDLDIIDDTVIINSIFYRLVEGTLGAVTYSPDELTYHYQSDTNHYDNECVYEYEGRLYIGELLLLDDSSSPAQYAVMRLYIEGLPPSQRPHYTGYPDTSSRQYKYWNDCKIIYALLERVSAPDGNG